MWVTEKGLLNRGGCTEVGQAASGGEAKSRSCSAFSLTCLSSSFSLVLTGFSQGWLEAAFTGFVSVSSPGDCFSEQKKLIHVEICLNLAWRSGHNSVGICKILPVLPFLCHCLICSPNTRIFGRKTTQMLVL